MLEAVPPARKSDDKTDDGAVGPTDLSQWVSGQNKPITLYPSGKIPRDLASVAEAYESVKTRHWFTEQHEIYLAPLPPAKTKSTEPAYHFEALLHRGRRVKVKGSGALVRFERTRGTLINSEMVIISESLMRETQDVAKRGKEILQNPPPIPQSPHERILESLKLRQDSFGLVIDRTNGDLVVESTKGCPMVLLGFRQDESGQVRVRPHLLEPGDCKTIKEGEHDEIYAVAPYQSLKVISPRLGDIGNLKEKPAIEKIAQILEESAKAYRVPKKHKKTGSRARTPLSIVFRIGRGCGK